MQGTSSSQVEVLAFNPVVYSIDEIADALPGQSEIPVQPNQSRKRKNSTMLYKRWDEPIRGSLRQIKIREALQYSEAMGANGDRVPCPFHEDSKRSAIVMYDGALRCFKCEERFPPWKVYAKREGVPTIKAIHTLAEMHDIRIQDLPNESLIETVRRAENNLLALEDLVDCAIPHYRHLFRVKRSNQCCCRSIDRFDFRVADSDVNHTQKRRNHGECRGIEVKVLIQYLHFLLLDKFDVDQVVDSEGNPVIFAALRPLGRILKTDKDKANRIYRTAALLGLVRPLPVKEMPSDIIRVASRAKKEGVLKRGSHSTRMHYRSVSSFIGIPDYSSDQWREMFERRIQMLSHVHLSASMFNFDSVAALFDEQTARWVWPEGDVMQHRHNSAVRTRLKEIIDYELTDKSYVHTADVIERYANLFQKPLRTATRECQHNFRLLKILHGDLEFRRMTEAERQDRQERSADDSGSVITRNTE